jgi:type VI secretion system secreted protein VgrG
MNATDVADDRRTDAGLSARRLLAIDTPLGGERVLLTSVDGRDELSRGFAFSVGLATQAADEEMRSLLGRPVTLWLDSHAGKQRRPINGIVRRLTRAGRSARGFVDWRAELAPRLWFLTRSADCRIFQGMSVPQIVAEVLDEHGLRDYELRGLQDDNHPRLDYCVQYRETAFAFISRLLEHNGLFYWHEHAPKRHLLVIAERNQVTPWTAPRAQSMSTREDDGDIQRLEHDYTFRLGKWTLNDYDFEAPTKQLKVQTPTMLQLERIADYEIYDYPGGFTDAAAGSALTRLRIEMEEARHHLVEGDGGCPGFDAGRRFALAGARGQAEEAYLITSVRHVATDETHVDTKAIASYSNSFSAIPADVPFRPELLTKKPFVRGLQTATVVGPPGENICCDEYGRVRVHFHWDRRGRRTEQTSCWVRVAQPRSGANYGGMTIPHVGHEVVVSFLEGDPDRPLIVGSVPNAGTMPPMELPFDKNKTIQRDHGDNRIVMQGKSGAQHLTLVSPRSVNMVAARSPARGLSADVAFVSRDASINDSIDGFMDTDALNELKTIFKALDDPTAYSDTNPTGRSISGPAGTTDDNAAGRALDPTTGLPIGNSIDINTMSEGRINSLSLGNTNTWVWEDSNTWVNGDSNSKVIGTSNTEIDGDCYSYVKGQSSATVDGSVYTSYNDSAFTEVKGANTVLFDKNNLQMVTGANEQIALGLNFQMCVGVNLQLCVGPNIQANTAMLYQANMLNVQDNFITNQQDLYNVENHGTKLLTSVVSISTQVLLAIL